MIKGPRFLYSSKRETGKKEEKREREDTFTCTSILLQTRRPAVGDPIILSCNTPQGVNGHLRVYRGCAVDSRVIALQPVVHKRTVLQLLVMFIYKFWYLNFVPSHVVPQKLHPVHVFELPIQPAVLFYYCTVIQQRFS